MVSRTDQCAGSTSLRSSQSGPSSATMFQSIGHSGVGVSTTRCSYASTIFLSMFALLTWRKGGAMLQLVSRFHWTAGRAQGRLPGPVVHSLAALVLAMVPLNYAGAQARIDSRSVSCNDLQGRLKQSGALIVSSGPNIYDRYVFDGQFCSVTQIASPSFVATRDAASCLIYRCRDRTAGSSR